MAAAPPWRSWTVCWRSAELKLAGQRFQHDQRNPVYEVRMPSAAAPWPRRRAAPRQLTLEWQCRGVGPGPRPVDPALLIIPRCWLAPGSDVRRNLVAFCVPEARCARAAGSISMLRQNGAESASCAMRRRRRTVSTARRREQPEACGGSLPPAAPGSEPCQLLRRPLRRAPCQFDSGAGAVAGMARRTGPSDLMTIGMFAAVARSPRLRCRSPRGQPVARRAA